MQATSSRVETPRRSASRRPSPGSAPPGDQIDDQAAVDYLQRALADIQQVVASLTPLVAPDVLAAAFGLPGQAGDPVRIRQLADHWNAGYELMLDWRQRLRVADPSDTYRALFELAGRLSTARSASITTLWTSSSRGSIASRLPWPWAPLWTSE